MECQQTIVESLELVMPQHANHHGTAFGGQASVVSETARIYEFFCQPSINAVVVLDSGMDGECCIYCGQV